MYREYLQIPLNSLKRQYENYQKSDDSSPDLTREAISESVIHRFQLCYDSAVHALEKYVRCVLGKANMKHQELLRYAAGAHLLSSDRWLHYRKIRNDMAHEYDCDKAERCLKIMENFIDDAHALYLSMTEEE